MSGDVSAARLVLAGRSPALERERCDHRRVHAGVSHRDQPWAGALVWVVVVLLIPMYIDFEVDDGSVTDSMDQLLGSLEMLTIAIVWLAFFPPRFYRSWIERATARSTAAR